MKKTDYAIMLSVILLDQVTKALVRGAFEPGQGKDIIGSVFSLTYVRNTGAAFSILKGDTIFLIIVPLACICFGLWYMHRHRREHRSLMLSLALIISGGLSNLADRVTSGFVTDMFDFHFWPVFNVADIAICTGCGLLLIYVIFFMDSGRKKEENQHDN